MFIVLDRVLRDILEFCPQCSPYSFLQRKEFCFQGQFLLSPGSEELGRFPPKSSESYSYTSSPSRWARCREGQEHRLSKKEGSGPVNFKTGQGGCHRKQLMSEGRAGGRGNVWAHYMSGKQEERDRKESWA